MKSGAFGRIAARVSTRIRNDEESGASIVEYLILLASLLALGQCMATVSA